jgi:hypothetical protein
MIILTKSLRRPETLRRNIIDNSLFNISRDLEDFRGKAEVLSVVNCHAKGLRINQIS